MFGLQTIFETNTSIKNKSFDVMKQKRAFHQTAIQKRSEQTSDAKESEADDSDMEDAKQPMADEENLQARLKSFILSVMLYPCIDD